MRKTERTARKDHRCCFCEGQIAAGTRYIDGFWVHEGEPTPWKAHCDCQVLAEKFPDACDGVPPFEYWDPEYDCESDADRAELLRLLNRVREAAE